jgi:hypothetical protein
MNLLQGGSNSLSSENTQKRRRNSEDYPARGGKQGSDEIGENDKRNVRKRTKVSESNRIQPANETLHNPVSVLLNVSGSPLTRC